MKQGKEALNRAQVVNELIYISQEVAKEANNMREKLLINLDLDLSYFYTNLAILNKSIEEIRLQILNTIAILIHINITEDNVYSVNVQVNEIASIIDVFKSYNLQMFIAVLQVVQSGIEKITQYFTPVNGESFIDAHSRWSRFETRMQYISFFIEKFSTLFEICYEARIDVLHIANSNYKACIAATYNDKDYSEVFGWYNNYKKYSLSYEGQESLRLKMQRNTNTQKAINEELNNYNKTIATFNEYQKQCQAFMAKMHWANHQEEYEQLCSEIQKYNDEIKSIEDKYNEMIQQVENRKCTIIEKREDEERKLKSTSFFKFTTKALLKKNINTYNADIETIQQEVKILQDKLSKEVNEIHLKITVVQSQIEHPIITAKETNINQNSKANKKVATI